MTNSAAARLMTPAAIVEAAASARVAKAIAHSPDALVPRRREPRQLGQVTSQPQPRSAWGHHWPVGCVASPAEPVRAGALPGRTACGGRSGLRLRS